MSEANSIYIGILAGVFLMFCGVPMPFVLGIACTIGFLVMAGCKQGTTDYTERQPPITQPFASTMPSEHAVQPIEPKSSIPSMGTLPDEFTKEKDHPSMF